MINQAGKNQEAPWWHDNAFALSRGCAAAQCLHRKRLSMPTEHLARGAGKGASTAKLSWGE